jgi:hypothetical protein
VEDQQQEAAPAADPSLSDAALNEAALAALAAVDAAPEPEAPAAPAPETAVASEPAVAPPVQQPPTPDPVEARIAAGIAAEAAAQRARQEAAEEARRARDDAAAVRAELDALRQRLQAAPLDVVKEVAGFDLESLNRHAISGKTPEAVLIQQLAAKVQQLETSRQQESRAAQEREAAAQQQQAVQRMVNETIPAALEPAKAAYPKLLAAYDPDEINGMVFNLMRSEALRAQANPGGGVRVPTPQEAAAALEAQLVARLKRLEPTVMGTQAPAEVKQPVAPSPNAPRGLTNAITPATTPSADDLNDLSDEALDRRARQYLAKNPIVS